MVKDFDGHDYTEETVLEELSLIERHARDGSAVAGGCACIEEKHLLLLAGLSSEMPTLSSNDDEKRFYGWLADHARELRRKIITGDFKKPVKATAKAVAYAQCIARGGSPEKCRVRSE